MLFSYPVKSIMLFRCAQYNIQEKQTIYLRKTDALSLGIRSGFKIEVTHLTFPRAYTTLQDLNYLDCYCCFQLGLSPTPLPNDSPTRHPIGRIDPVESHTVDFCRPSPYHYRCFKHVLYIKISSLHSLLLHLTT